VSRAQLTPPTGSSEDEPHLVSSRGVEDLDDGIWQAKQYPKDRMGPGRDPAPGSCEGGGGHDENVTLFDRRPHQRAGIHRSTSGEVFQRRGVEDPTADHAGREGLLRNALRAAANSSAGGGPPNTRSSSASACCRSALALTASAMYDETLAAAPVSTARLASAANSTGKLTVTRSFIHARYPMHTPQARPAEVSGAVPYLTTINYDL
jgi:hypothetical protein